MDEDGYFYWRIQEIYTFLFVGRGAVKKILKDKINNPIVQDVLLKNLQRLSMAKLAVVAR